MNTITTAQAAEFLQAHDNYLILTHVRPDGDTVGCAAGLCRALRQTGKTAYILENPEVTELFTGYIKGLTIGADYTPETVVSVDIAARSLFPDNAQVFLDRVDLAIDHHPSQEFFARATCLNSGKASCGEVVLEVVKEFTSLTPDIGRALYVALSTDCGCFQYSNTDAAAHRAAAELMETVDAFTTAATILINHLIQSCESCDDCNDEDGCPYDEPDYINLPDYLREEAGIPLDEKLCAQVDPDSHSITVQSAGYCHDLQDVPEDLLVILKHHGVCMGDLEEKLMTNAVVYG